MSGRVDQRNPYAVFGSRSARLQSMNMNRAFRKGIAIAMSVRRTVNICHIMDVPVGVFPNMKRTLTTANAAAIALMTNIT